MQKKPIPHINVPIMTKNGSMELAWYLFLQWVSENAGATDLSDYFTKEETQALLDAKANIDDLADVAFSGSYDDLSNKPTIPEVGNGTITITQGETTVGSFTTNQSTDAIIDIDAANTDLSNLTSVGQNIGNWSSNVSNCITKIPQDIKLELNNGTLTLKAGSKLYVPNGDGVFDTVTIASDTTYTYAYGAYTLGLYYNPTSGYLEAYSKDAEVSGTTPANTCTFYNTSINNISRINNGTVDTPKLSFPIATITTNASQITSINQVFNGFGYIGSTAFALPGLKGLIPNGRNADGSLKNIEVTINTVQTLTPTVSLNMEVGVVLEPHITYCGDPIYNKAENLTYDLTTKRPYCLIGMATLQSSRITSFTPKTVFHAVDYNDYIRNSGTVVAEQLPTADNNYTWYRKYANGWVEQGCYFTNSTTVQYGRQGDLGSFPFPVPMANTDYYMNASGQGYCVLMQVDKSTTYCKPIFGAYISDRTLSNVSVYVCGMAA